MCLQAINLLSVQPIVKRFTIFSTFFSRFFGDATEGTFHKFSGQTKKELRKSQLLLDLKRVTFSSYYFKVFHTQFSTSGRSLPSSRMYWLCFATMSSIFCAKEAAFCS